MSSTEDGLPPPPEAVREQLAAYNAQDLERFARWYTDDVVLEDAERGVFVRGLAELRERYGKLFRDHPENRARVVERSALRGASGSWVFEREEVSRDQVSSEGRRTPHGFEVLVIYRLAATNAGERIARAIFFR